jgi:hypothetical protein
MVQVFNCLLIVFQETLNLGKRFLSETTEATEKNGIETNWILRYTVKNCPMATPLRLIVISIDRNINNLKMKLL